jgi:large subunit ribosomal protein L31
MAASGAWLWVWHTEGGSGSRAPVPRRHDPATSTEGAVRVKSDIHPEYVETEVRCTCGNTFTTRSTAKNGVINADVCSNCHPFYTGKQKILDTGGRVARFNQRYGKKTAGK